jgi:hypothetical protein
MKNIGKYILFMFMGVMLTSCFKDLGNYDYNYYDEFEIEALEKNYSVTSFVENLKIVPKIKSNLEDFDYVWFVVRYKKGLHQTEEYADTISREPVLDVPFEYATGVYELFLKVTSRDSGEAKYAKTQVTAITPFMNGYYILYEDEAGNTDMDIHYLDGAITRNAVTAFYGKPLTGSPKYLSYIPEMSYLDEDTGSNVVNYLMIPASEQEMVTFDMTDMSIARTPEQWFYGDYDVSNINHISALGYSINIYAKTGVHKNYQIVNSEYGAMLSAGKFAAEADLVSGRHYEVSSDVCYFGDNAFFYDELNEQFIGGNVNGQLSVYTFQYPPQTTGQLPVTATLDGEIIYIGGVSPSGVNGYNFMEFMMIVCERDNGSRHWYFVRPGTGVLNIIFKGEFSAGSPFANASHYTSCRNGGAYLYAVCPDGIYSFLPNTSAVQKLTFKDLPAGEVTYFQTMFNVMSDSQDPGYFNHFVIATTSGGNYQVALYDMIGGIPVLNQGPVKVLEGEGVVKSIQCANQSKRAGVMSMSTSVFSIHH